MKLLLVHTGGTIGMRETAEGLAPVKGLVEAALAARLPAGTDLASVVFDPLVDSADVGPRHWNQILDAIEAHPDRAVIVTHDTDTMAFTGAALAQALQGLGRSVVLCGAMVPLGQGGDAEGNLDLALSALVAGKRGVWLAFAARLLAAQGLVKRDSHTSDSFASLPQPELGAPVRRRFDEARRVAMLTLTPGLPVAAIEAALGALDGAVLRVFGAGTAMGDPALYKVLGEAHARGVRLRAVSQCLTGGLTPGAYAAGAGLWAAGVENGGLETPEAALVKLLLG